MSEDLAHALCFILLIIMAIVEVGLLSICDYLKDIKMALQELTKNQTKGE